MKRDIVKHEPVFDKDGKIIGNIVHLSDGTTYFTMTKKVIAGHCVNYGPNWRVD